MTRYGCDQRWLSAIASGLGHLCWRIIAQSGEGELPVALIRSPLFGRFLVSLPYVNTAGPSVSDPAIAAELVQKAIEAADEHRVRFLEVRSEFTVAHEKLLTRTDAKVHMRLPLTDTAEQLWKQFDPKVRNQIRKAEKCNLTVHWGGAELLPEFYRVFAINMRDLGTPVYGKRLFQAVLDTFGQDAELCVVRIGQKPIAGALLVHGDEFSEVPSASSLRSYNQTNPNMLMYWHLLMRAIDRGSRYFDFGRSSVDSGTYRFKKQWGAMPCPAIWQYYVRRGTMADMRPENRRFSLAIKVWKCLPVWLTRCIGPLIVRGIP